MKIAILHWGAGYLLGGVERFVQDFAEAAERQSVHTTLVGVKDKRLTNYRQPTTAKQFLLPLPNVHRMPRKPRRERLFSILASPTVLAADIVFAQGDQGIFASHFRPVVVFEHGPHRPLSPLRNRAYETAHSIIVATEWGRRLIEKKYPEHAHKAVVIPIGTNIPSVPPPAKTKARNILAVGRLDDSRKDHLGLLKAFRIVVDEVPDAQLTLAGSGDVDALRRASRNLEIEERVTIIRQDETTNWDATLGALYRNADIFALNTKWETFGMVFVEAMSQGLPIVTNRVGPLDEVIEKNRAGFLVTEGQSCEMASHIIAIMRSPKLFTELAQRNRQTALSCYDWSNLIHLYLNVFSDALRLPHKQRFAEV